MPAQGAVPSGKVISPPKKGKHFLHVDDFSKDELLLMLDNAKLAKAKFAARDEKFKPFTGQTMAMIFTKPSARTRVSFETVRRKLTELTARDRHAVPSSVRHVQRMNIFFLYMAATSAILGAFARYLSY